MSWGWEYTKAEPEDMVTPGINSGQRQETKNSVLFYVGWWSCSKC